MLIVNKISKRFQEPQWILHNLSLHVMQGQWVSIVGRSGSGKTTLIQAIAGIELPNEGEITLLDKQMTEMSVDARGIFRRQEIGLVFQDFKLLPYYSVIDNVILPAVHDEKRAILQDRAVELLLKVGIDKQLHHRLPSQLSGGEKQRVAIARALIANPSLLICDEPTGNLDTVNRDRIVELFQQLHQEGLTIIIVTHDPEVAAFADCIYRLTDQHLVEEVLST